LQLLDDGCIVLCGGSTVKEGEIPHYHRDLTQLNTDTMVWSKRSCTADVYPSGNSFIIFQMNNCK
jgi:hypothetical protein